MPVLISKNPAKNFQKIGHVKISSNAYIKKSVAAAKSSELLWGQFSVNDRIKLLRPILDNFSKEQNKLAVLIAREIGKPFKESTDEVKKSLLYFANYLKHAPEYLANQTTYEDLKEKDTLIFEPTGVAAVIAPWNYPFMLAIWGIIPNLLAGNTVVFKHSEHSPLVGKFIEKIMISHKLPSGVFTEIYGDGKQGQILIDQNIDLIWFTGSTKVGQKLYSVAGTKMIPAILEMGGSNPAIVLKDADIKKAATIIFGSRFKNCGQYCNAIKRVIAHKSIVNKLVSELKNIARNKIIGDPELQNTDIGSMISIKQRQTLISQLNDALIKGAQVVYGGKIPSKLKGAYFQPTIVTKVKSDMRIWKEEVFGPILPVVPFKTEKEAIELANDTEYGLGAQIFSQNRDRAFKFATMIKSGMIDINEGKSSKYCNPFGGNKKSGMGRENGKYGFRELCKLKVIAREK